MHDENVHETRLSNFMVSVYGYIKMLQSMLENLEVILNKTSASNHASDVKGQVRTVKERCRTLQAMIPFKILLVLTTIELIVFYIIWINFFSVHSGN